MMDEQNTLLHTDDFLLDDILNEFRADDQDDTVRRVQLGQTAAPEAAEPEAPADAPGDAAPEATAEAPETDEADVSADEPDSRTVSDTEPDTDYAAREVEPLPEESPLRRPARTRPSILQRGAGLLVGLLSRSAAKSANAATRPELDTDEDAPEMPAKNAARYYQAQLPSLRLRSRLALILCLPLLWLAFGLPAPGMLGASLAVRALVSALFALTVMLVGVDILAAGFTALLRRRPNADTLVFFSCLLSVVDACVIALTGNETFGLPYCAVSALSLASSLLGSHLFCQGLRISLRTVSQSRFPWALTAEDALTDGGAALLKSHRSAAGFVRCSEEPDLSETIYTLLAPPLLLLALALSIVTALILGSAQAFLHVLSALTAASACCCAALCFAAPFSVTARRISRSGAAIAGCSGAREIGKSRHVVITDGDLFPPGTVSIDEVRILDGVPSDRAIAYTGSIIAASGSGLAPVFEDLMRRNGCIIHTLTDFAFRDGGGLTAVINGQSVIVGSAAFLQLSGVRMPQKLISRTSVFTAVGDRLVAVFTIKYKPSATVQAALLQLLGSRREPLFAIRDFNITPQMIKQHFRLPGDHFEFPSFADRCRLSEASPSADSPLTAVLARDGLEPLVAASAQGRRLWKTARMLGLLSAVCSVLGLLLMFLLCCVGSFSAASAGRLLVYMLLWLVPTAVLTFGLRRF